MPILAVCLFALVLFKLVLKRVFSANRSIRLQTVDAEQVCHHESQIERALVSSIFRALALTRFLVFVLLVYPRLTHFIARLLGETLWIRFLKSIVAYEPVSRAERPIPAQIAERIKRRRFVALAALLFAPFLLAVLPLALFKPALFQKIAFRIL